jgi:hypothetical protein
MYCAAVIVGIVIYLFMDSDEKRAYRQNMANKPKPKLILVKW